MAPYQRSGRPCEAGEGPGHRSWGQSPGGREPRPRLSDDVPGYRAPKRDERGLRDPSGPVKTGPRRCSGPARSSERGAAAPLPSSLPNCGGQEGSGHSWPEECYGARTVFRGLRDPAAPVIPPITASWDPIIPALDPIIPVLDPNYTRPGPQYTRLGP